MYIFNYLTLILHFYYGFQPKIIQPSIMNKGINRLTSPSEADIHDDEDYCQQYTDNCSY